MMNKYTRRNGSALTISYKFTSPQLMAPAMVLCRCDTMEMDFLWYGQDFSVLFFFLLQLQLPRFQLQCPSTVSNVYNNKCFSWNGPSNMQIKSTTLKAAHIFATYCMFALQSMSLMNYFAAIKKHFHGETKISQIQILIRRCSLQYLTFFRCPEWSYFSKHLVKHKKCVEVLQSVHHQFP